MEKEKKMQPYKKPKNRPIVSTRTIPLPNLQRRHQKRQLYTTSLVVPEEPNLIFALSGCPATPEKSLKAFMSCLVMGSIFSNRISRKWKQACC